MGLRPRRGGWTLGLNWPRARGEREGSSPVGSPVGSGRGDRDTRGDSSCGDGNDGERAAATDAPVGTRADEAAPGGMRSEQSREGAQGEARDMREVTQRVTPLREASLEHEDDEASPARAGRSPSSSVSSSGSRRLPRLSGSGRAQTTPVVTYPRCDADGRMDDARRPL